MPKISEERRAERREEIITAAIACFGRSGYQRTSMTDIIRESGLSAGAIYGYFSGKQEIVHAAAQRVMEGRREDLEAKGHDHLLAPAEIVTTIITGLRAVAPIHMVLQVWSEATVDDRLRTMVDSVIAKMRGTIEDHLGRWASAQGTDIYESPEAWARSTAPLLMSLVAGFMVQRTLIDGFVDEAYLSALPGLLPGADPPL
ncbi:TetR/AcrR family transcriptional regulator [Brevibacterium sp.]|uniref:TetR/AcrR family transcriptional regulator n=1 Tax=Brevibacterium sp. TaxID=1701 RepID=UPI0028112B1B|nr:TetR/AcrR family transcriptional regulator [Brevibacterium sp.]